MNIRLYVRGTYFFLEKEDSPENPSWDHKYKVLVGPLDKTGNKFLIDSPRIDRKEIDFSNIRKEDGSPYASVTEFTEFYEKETGFSVGSSDSDPIDPINYRAEKFSDIPTVATNPKLNELAYVRISEGTKWLPGSMGGTFRASGIYFYDGTNWVSDRTDISNSLEKVQVQTGTIDFIDTQYTNANRLSVSGGVSFRVPNNKGIVNNISAPSIATDWLDNTGLITPDNGNGDDYILLVSFTIDPSLNNRNMVLSLNAGGSTGVIWRITKRLARGAGNDTEVSFTIPYNSLSDIFTNGGDLTCVVDGFATFYNFSHKIVKLKKL